MASTLPTCQLRDSSSRRHLGYSGVLFTMQHSVQHKKWEKERVWEIWSIVLGSWDLWLHTERKCMDFIWHSRGTSPNEVWDGEWVRMRMSGYMLLKSKTSTLNAMRDMLIQPLLLEQLSLEIYDKWNENSYLGELWTFTHRNQDFLKYISTRKWKDENDTLRWTMNNSQFCGPPTKVGFNVPLPQSATLSTRVFEWTHCVRMSGLNDEEPGSSPPAKCSQWAKSSPHGGQAKSPAAQVECASMDGWVVCAWLRAWLGSMQGWWKRMQREERN